MAAYHSISAPRFSLFHTIESGQLFRYEEIEGWFWIQHRDLVFRVRQKGDLLRYAGSPGVTESWLRHFFSLDTDILAIEERLSRDRVLGPMIKRCSGLRLTRQNPWECLISFLCSPACNIPRIKRMIARICERCGRSFSWGGMVWHAFPAPGDLPDELDLRRMGLGFRARAVAEAGRSMNEASIALLASLRYEDAKKKLMQLPGVGHKVADCVLLFGLGFGEAFPVDTWVRRAMREAYFTGKNVSDSDIREFAAEKFGNLAGYAQQYLFHFYRSLRLPAPPRPKLVPS